jgi:hypothetical protein
MTAILFMFFGFHAIKDLKKKIFGFERIPETLRTH